MVAGHPPPHCVQATVTLFHNFRMIWQRPIDRETLLLNSVSQLIHMYAQKSLSLSYLYMFPCPTIKTSFVFLNVKGSPVKVNQDEHIPWVDI